MKSSFNAVHFAALQLPQKDRPRLLEDLLNSVMPDRAEDAALDKLAAQRQQAVLWGHTVLVPLVAALQAAGFTVC